MALVTWDKFFPLAAPELPGCPFASIESALTSAAVEFCDRTHLWREDFDPETTTAGEAVYTLSTSAPMASVLMLARDGLLLAPVDSRHVLPSDRTGTGAPTKFWRVNDTDIQLAPAPDKAYVLTGSVALKPSRTAKGVESFIYEAHAEVLVSGAVYRLARIPNKEWTNPALAEAHRLLFERGVTNARIRDFRNVPLRVTPRSFA